ncbi:hypothetical protein F5Y19DRAFT_473026 [Xylariaceae sp. FL1651]|nr:hypothetical protein F5Y19DRAFT_473026 [Xylariaceae sp. FL1651]
MASKSYSEWLIQAWTNTEPGRFEIEAYLGGELRGKAWIFRELRDGQLASRFVVKYARSNTAMVTVEKEMKFLKHMYGHAHTAQPTLNHDSLVGPANYQNNIPRSQTIYVVTEYLENGSLDRFLERARVRFDVMGLNPVPNCVLWFIFRCRISL